MRLVNTIETTMEICNSGSLGVPGRGTLDFDSSSPSQVVLSIVFASPQVVPAIFISSLQCLCQYFLGRGGVGVGVTM